MKYLRYVIPAGLLALLLFCVSTTSSPVFGPLMGNYQDNPVSAIILAGMGPWLGMVPYRDLFSTAAPIHMLILGGCYHLGGRILLFVMQYLNLLLFAFLMYRIVRTYSSKAGAATSVLIGLGVYACLCSGGNSPEEWSLGFVSIWLWLLMDRTPENRFLHCALLGLTAGILVLMNVESIALVLGGTLLLLVSRKLLGSGEWQIYFAFALLPIGLLLFAALQGGFMTDLLRAMITLPLGLMLRDGLLANQLLHKLAKCLLMGLPVVLVFLRRNEAEGNLRKLLACVGGCGFLGLFLGCNVWNRFILLIPVLIMSVASLSADSRRWIEFAAACSLIFLVASPGKNYLTWIIHGTDDTAQLFEADLMQYLQEEPDSEVYFLDSDCSYLLDLGLRPVRKYYYNQTDFAAADPIIGQEAATYLIGEQRPDCMIKSVYGMYHEDYYQGYSLVQAYIKSHGNLQIYMATD